MNKKSKIISYSLLSLLALLILELLYLVSAKSMSAHEQKKKLAFVTLSGLPDLALFSEVSYSRHRSLSDVFSLYKDDASLREYAPSSFVISHAHTKEQK